jgi:predicted nucleotidyltransferase
VASALFCTVADTDYLGFWAHETLNARAVARFLDLDKHDVAKVANVAPASVRFDGKIPKQVLDRLEEIANTCALVAQHFDGNVVKTALWFKTNNPLLGNIAPRDMIRHGRYERLQRFVVEALAANSVKASVADSTHGQTTQGEEGPRSRVHSLIGRYRDEIARLCERHGVRELSLFGSILRDDFDEESSDVDAVASFGPPKGESLARQYFDFKKDFEELLARPVDLVELEAMPNTRLRRIIERTKVPIYAAAG